jgi:hypothetical protein
VTPTALVDNRTFEIIKVANGDCNANTATGSPFVLNSLTEYRVTLSNRIRAAGATGGFLQPTTFRFVTRFAQGVCGDTAAPLLASSNPNDDDTNVDTNVKIIFSFNELVDVSTVTTRSVVLTQVTTPSSRDGPTQAPTPLNATVRTPAQLPCLTVNVTAASDFEYNFGTLALSPNKVFELFFTNEVKDVVGNRLNPTSIQFTTANIQEIRQGPKLASSNPTDQSTNNDPSSIIQFTFDKEMFQSTDKRAWSGDCAPSGLSPWTITPSTVFLSRVTLPAENDKTVTANVSYTVFSGCNAGTFTTGTLPFVFRPDPENFPRTFQILPGKLQLQAGLVRYSVFITNAVRDKDGNASPGATFSFTTRPGVSSPAAGPRLISSNPGPGQVVGKATRILLSFDKPVLPASMTAGNGVDLAEVYTSQQIGNCTVDGLTPCLIDDPTDAINTCVCIFPITPAGNCVIGTGANGFCDVSASVGAPAQTVWEILHPPILGQAQKPFPAVLITINGNVKSDGALTGDGVDLPAPGDATFFFVR